jgi:uncharacterized protein (DUF433 family)
MASSNSVITRDPDLLGDTPVFSRNPCSVHALLDYLEGGETIDEFLDDFPTVTREAAIHALEHAKSLILSRCDLTCSPSLPRL